MTFIFITVDRNGHRWVNDGTIDELRDRIELFRTDQARLFRAEEVDINLALEGKTKSLVDRIRDVIDSVNNVVILDSTGSPAITVEAMLETTLKAIFEIETIIEHNG